MTRYLPCLLIALLAALPTLAQETPKLVKGEDFIVKPAISEELCVSNVFQDGMVLQRDKQINVWGWAGVNEQITVTFGSSSAMTKAGPDRFWSVSLAAQPANAEPQRMLIEGHNRRMALDNILVGDVWVLGGQSNMEFELAKVENGNLEIISANYPDIRVLTIPYGEAPVKHNKSFPEIYQYSSWFGRHFHKGKWEPCTPDVARNLSATGYVFARRIH